MMTGNKNQESILELWGGIECTINRVGNIFKDQLELSDHYRRGTEDIKAFASLQIKALRYPVLWEKHQPFRDQPIDFTFTEIQLTEIRSQNIIPIVGLLHHGSGPCFTELLHPEFPQLFATYAEQVAKKFPWVEYYTPVNEPLTTARFSGLYGLWYPHHKSDVSFAKMFINQLKGIVLSMQAIRKWNPNARLIQTEDLAKTYSTSTLEYQANFENERRWTTFDMLCGKLIPGMTMYDYFTRLGISKNDLQFFIDNPCPPHTIGLNYYITSERYLDEKLERYSDTSHGGNELQQYADVEAIRADHKQNWGLKVLMREAWERYNLPLAITECHLHCTREEQLRWFTESWESVQELRDEGVDVRALTAWALLGSFGWDKLLTSALMNYESGVFDIRSGKIRSTGLAKLMRHAAAGKLAAHPLSSIKGWWRHTKDFSSEIINYEELNQALCGDGGKRVLIIGKRGTLAQAFARICAARHIPFYAAGSDEVNICEEKSIEFIIQKVQPWAIINTAGLVNIDLAETEKERCFQMNATAPSLLASACVKQGLQFMTFSSDQVFNGTKQTAYTEKDAADPVNTYGASKAMQEVLVMRTDPTACIVRTSAFFGPWDEANFATQLIHSLKHRKNFSVAEDVSVSPTYIPDLVHQCLDLLVDKESGIWHIANEGVISWSRFANQISQKAGLDFSLVSILPANQMGWSARRPAHVFLSTNRGIVLPSLDDALNRYFVDSEIMTSKIRV